jgi:hypothetical protein
MTGAWHSLEIDVSVGFFHLRLSDVFRSQDTWDHSFVS